MVSDNTSKGGFVVPPECEGKYLRCKVTPMDSTGAQGEAVWSAPVYVEITDPADKTGFRNLLAEAKAMLESAQVGEEPGQWSQKEVDLLQAAITDAEEALKTDPMSQYEHDKALAAFEAAYTRFQNNRNAGELSNMLYVNELLDNRGGWKTLSGADAAVTDNGITITSAGSDYEMLAYNEKFQGKVFSFKYGQTFQSETSDEWGRLLPESEQSCRHSLVG